MRTENEDCESIARERRRGGILSDVWLFLRQSRKWWLLPMITILAILSVLMILSATGAGPFIYTLL